MHDTDMDEGAWVERYVTGRLDADETARFEAHFLDCPLCLERLEAAQRLRAGLQQLAREDARPTPRRHKARWAVRAGWVTAGACAAGLLAAVLTTWQRARRAESELAAQRADSRQQLADARAAAQSERTARERLQASLLEQQGRPVHVPVLALVTTRGGEVPELELPPTPGPVVLSVEREQPPRFQRYRATVLSSGGERRWQEEARASSRDAVVVALHSGLLSPGGYVLLLEGAGQGTHWTPIARHAFRAAPSKAGP